MKKYLFNALLVSLSVLTPLQLLAMTVSEEIEWCKRDSSGGFYSTTDFHDVQICKADDPSNSYQRLCYMHYTRNGNGAWETFRLLQYKTPGDSSEAWSTHSDSFSIEGNMTYFKADQSVMMGSRHVAEVSVNNSTMKIQIDHYRKRIFKNEFVESESYSCFRQ